MERLRQENKWFNENLQPLYDSLSILRQEIADLEMLKYRTREKGDHQIKKLEKELAEYKRNHNSEMYSISSKLIQTTDEYKALSDEIDRIRKLDPFGNSGGYV